MTLSAELLHAVSEMERLGIVPPGTDPGTIVDLVVMHPRSLDGLETMHSLQTLSVTGADGVDFSAIAQLPNLHVLTIEHSTLDSVPRTLPTQLRVANVRRNRLTSIEPLRHVDGLQVLDVSGNPLSEEAAAHAEELRTRGVLVTSDDATIRQLNRKLALKHPFLVCYGVEAACTLTLTGLDYDARPDGVAVHTNADKVASVIGDEAAIEQLLASQWLPTEGTP
jgi:hypothetical protein